MSDGAPEQRQPRKGRGAASNQAGRYESHAREAIDDGWGSAELPLPRLTTTLTADAARTVMSFNDSPDVPFDRSINPYRGCEHGCVYCYARPTHAWLGLSPGLDFESRLFYKARAAELLRAELARPGYRAAPVALGANTDAYQPAERRLGLTREIVELLSACGHPLRIITKSALVERDLDLLAPMAERGLVSVHLSLTTLDRTLSRRMEPRAAAPQRRLRTVAAMAAAGVPVSVLMAPIIPFINDAEIEPLLEAAHEAGALDVRYVLLRLPLELEQLFTEWLQCHFPDRAERVMARIRDSRGGKAYRSGFGERMRGTGPFAELVATRVRLARKRLGFAGVPELDCTRFAAPRVPSAQLDLFQ